jgi:hypothetical protein
MSTKVYQAWRFPENRLNDFIEWYCSIAVPKVQGRVDTLIKQRMCPHPDDRMTVTYIGPEAKGSPGRRVAIGLCADCDMHLKGTALLAPGVKPHEPKGDLLFYSDFAEMEELSKTAVLGHDAHWTRPKPLSEKEEDPKILRYLAVIEIGDLCEKAAQLTTRETTYNIECGVRLCLRKGMWYALPMGEYWTRPDEEAKPDFAEDYAYWNNTDPPEWALPVGDDIPDDIYDRPELWTDGMRKWEERAKTWDALFDFNKPKLWLEFWAVEVLRDSFHGTERIKWLDLG